MPDDPIARLRCALAARERLALDDAALAAAYPEARRGAVLALFYPRAGEPHLVLTLRTPHLSTHSGQVSLPGGRIDQQDPTPEAAALRETREELGIDTDGLEVHGPLDPVFTVASNYVLLPFVAFTSQAPKFVPHDYEVAAVIELPFQHLLRPETVEEEVWPLRGSTYRVGFYRYGQHRIWGATARVLREILDLAGGPAPPPDLVPPGEVAEARNLRPARPR